MWRCSVLTANWPRLLRRSGTKLWFAQRATHSHPDKREMNMNRLKRLWSEDDGVLSFEWTLLLTLLTIGIVGGLAGARDAIIDELGDVAEAAQGIDQSYSLSALTVTMVINGETVTFSSAASVFQETAADAVFADCDRTVAPTGQPASDDSPS